MKVDQVMSRNVACCPPDAPLSVACQIMWERDCGFVPIVNSARQIVGVVTDRDICMAAYTQGLPMHAISAERTMARLVYFCRPHDSIECVVALMKRHQIRRVPVVDQNEYVVGVVSLSDIARAQTLREGQVESTLRDICEDRRTFQSEPSRPASRAAL